jgi:hypothetical protein
MSMWTRYPALASPDRVRDYLLGGARNLAVDRELARRVLGWIPAEQAARDEQAFRVRAVRHLLDVGITQFVDLDPGTFPTGATHEVLHGTGARVTDLARDPTVLALGDALLGRRRGVAVLNSCGLSVLMALRGLLAGEPDWWPGKPMPCGGWLDPEAPLGLLLGTLPQTLPDNTAAGLLVRVRELLPPVQWESHWARPVRAISAQVANG